MTRFKDAIPAFLVAMGGATLAWLGIRVNILWPIGIVGALLLFGGGSYVWAKRCLPESPERAVTFFERSIVLDLTIGAAFAGGLVWLGVTLEPVEKAPVENSKLLAATFGALSGLVTALFIKGADTADDWVAERVEAAFRKAYATRFETNTPPWRALKEPDFDNESGWGPAARRSRARAIRAGLT